MERKRPHRLIPDVVPELGPVARGTSCWVRLRSELIAASLTCVMNVPGSERRLTAEQRARVLIDPQLTDAGWVVQDKNDLNLFAGQGVAGHGRADYLLYVDKNAVGVIEAKPEGTPLSGVEWQCAMCAEGLPPDVRLKRH